MRVKRLIGFGMSVIMIISCLSVNMAEELNDVTGNESDEVEVLIPEIPYIDDWIESGQAVGEESVSLYSASSTDTKYEVEGGYIYFDESTGTITDCDTSVTSAVIPSEINGVSVTSIGAYAFESCRKLESITIPEGVISIGRYAFAYCSSLVSISMPDSVNEIDWYYVFLGCSNLKTAGPIGSGCNYEFGWKESIPANAFSHLENLESVIIPDGVVGIGEYAFYYCSNLTSVTIPESLINIEGNSGIFAGCSGIKTAGPIGSGCDYEFGWTESIPAGAFWGLSNLESITIPEGVTSIGSLAFSGCSSLTSITIPEGVTSIGGGAFTSCRSLISITIPKSVVNIVSNIFSNCFSLKTAGPIGSGCNIEFGWEESIPENAFSGCSSLESITIPEGVTSIGNYAFSGCSSLTSMTIPGSVTSMPNTGLSSSDNLKTAGPIGSGCNIEFGWTENIPDYAFYYCKSLISITISEGVTSIGYGAFSKCTSLTNIKIPGSVTSMPNTGLSSSDNLKTAGPIGSGCNIEFGWTENIPDYVFSGCSSLTSITIPEGIISIGDYAFYSCSSLTSISIPKGATSIGDYAFEYCRSLESVILSGDIGEYAFYGCSNLASITIQEGIKSIGDHAFSNCSSLVSITIPEGIISIGDYAFYSCSSLTSISIPKGATNIGDYAFYGCSNLASIIIQEGIKSIGERAFYGCSSLTSITIPEGATSIEEYTFYGCSSLTSITIPEGVTSIGGYTFSGCSSLTSITIPEGVTSIGSYAFSNCSSLVRIIIPESVTSIESNAFKNCDNLTIYCYSGSYAETYAIRYNIPYVILFKTDGSDGTQIDMSTEETFKVNEETYIRAIVTPGIGEDGSALWSSSNTDVVEVGTSIVLEGYSNSRILCRLKCKEEGTSVITVTTSNGASASCLVTVEKEETSSGTGSNVNTDNLDKGINIIKNIKTLMEHIYFKYLTNNENFSHVMFMAANDGAIGDSSIGLYIDAATKLIYGGDDGIKDLINGETSIEDAEGILIGFLEESDDEITGMAEAKIAYELCDILSDSLKLHIQDSTTSSDAMKAVNSVLDSEELNSVFNKQGFNGLMLHIKESLINMGVSNDSDVMLAVDEYFNSNKLQSDLSTGLSILNAGLDVINMTKMSVDMLMDYYTLQEANNIYLEILEYIENNAHYSVIQEAARNVRERAEQDLDEAISEINLELAKEATDIVVSTVVEEAIKKSGFLEIVKLGFDLGVSISNTFFHTDDSVTLKDSMRSLTYMGNTLAQYVIENIDMAAVNHENESEAEYYIDRATYGLWMLYKTRALGEECYDTFCDLFNRSDKDRVRMSILTLKHIEWDWFGEDGFITNFKTIMVSCPVDVEIYDSSGNKVLTVFDGEETSGETDNIFYEVTYNENTGDYIKIIDIPEEQGYYFKIIGKDLGSVDCTVASINEETGIVESKGSYNIPVDADTTIEVSSIDDENIMLVMENTEGTDSLELKDSFTTNYVDLTDISFDNTVVKMTPGEIERFSFNYSPYNATYPVVYWSSSDENVVKVNSDGVVEAVGEGSATITITSFNNTLTADIVVKVSLSEEIIGDVDGDGQITSTDATYVLLYTVGLRELSESALEAADADGDGQVTSTDATYILLHTVGLRSLE